uniref:NADP-dependent oxidoreductase domain-containing protein n=1 Tax=Parascaris univalens TaxID=6257 RepID=A0A915BTF2_PARUN
MVQVPSIKLATGADFPLFGLGTWLSTDPKSLTDALRAALGAGYRLIDTAYVYGNEAVIGNMLQEYSDIYIFPIYSSPVSYPIWCIHQMKSKRCCPDN